MSEPMGWVRITEACVLAGKGQNVVYRLAALGHVRTRRDAGGRIQFAAEDLKAASELSGALRPIMRDTRRLLRVDLHIGLLWRVKMLFTRDLTLLLERAPGGRFRAVGLRVGGNGGGRQRHADLSRRPE